MSRMLNTKSRMLPRIFEIAKKGSEAEFAILNNGALSTLPMLFLGLEEDSEDREQSVNLKCTEVS